MIIRAFVVGLVLVTAVVLQTSLFPALTLGGFRPDLLLLVTVALALRDGPMTGCRVGFVAGLVTDVLVMQTPIGISAMIGSAIGFAVGFARPYLAADSISAPVLIAFVTGVVGTAAYGVSALLLGDDRVSAALIGQSALAVGLYNTLLAPIALGLAGRLSERLPLQGLHANELT